MSNKSRKPSTKKEPYVAPRFDTSEPALTDERISIFWIDDTEYTVPKTINAGMAWEALEVINDKGFLAGMIWMAGTALGEEALQAIRDCEQAGVEDLQKVMEFVAQLYTGQMEALVGK